MRFRYAEPSTRNAPASVLTGLLVTMTAWGRRPQILAINRLVLTCIKDE